MKIFNYKQFNESKSNDVSQLNNGLRDACNSGDLDKVKELVSSGADVFIDGGVCLRTSCLNGYVELVNFLLKSGLKGDQNLVKSIDNEIKNIEDRKKSTLSRVSMTKEGDDELIEKLKQIRLLISKSSLFNGISINR